MNVNKKNIVLKLKYCNFLDAFYGFGIAIIIFLFEIKTQTSSIPLNILISASLGSGFYCLLKFLKEPIKFEISCEKQEFVFTYLKKTLVIPKEEIKDIVISFNEIKRVHYLVLTFYLIESKKISLNANYYVSSDVVGFLKILDCLYTIFKPTELSISRELIFEIVEHCLKRGKHLEIESKIINLADELLRKLGTDFEKFAKERNIYDDYFWSHYYKND